MDPAILFLPFLTINIIIIHLFIFLYYHLSTIQSHTYFPFPPLSLSPLSVSHPNTFLGCCQSPEPSIHPWSSDGPAYASIHPPIHPAQSSSVRISLALDMIIILTEFLIWPSYQSENGKKEKKKKKKHRRLTDDPKEAIINGRVNAPVVSRAWIKEYPRETEPMFL